MPISGLVVTFHSSVENNSHALDVLRSLPEIELGVARGSKLAIVVDSETKARDQELWYAIRALPGVIDLAVAMIAFDSDEDSKVANDNPIRNQQ